MSAAVESSTQRSTLKGVTAWCLALPVLLGLLAITGRSFWIDECVTAQYVSQPTLAGWWHDLRTTDFAEAQMPLYLGWLWLWEKVFGHGEWSLRAAALPWFAAGTGLLLCVMRRFGLAGWFTAAMILSSAFVWYYLNEARLYSMQFGAACAVAASLIALTESCKAQDAFEARWLKALLFSVLALSGISIIGMIWAGGAMLVLVTCLPPASLWNQVRTSTAAVGTWVLCSLLLGGYYLDTVARGARASGLATTNLQTIIYVGYELLGFTGLGPGRDALRERGAGALSDHLPMLGLFGMFTVMLVVAGMIAVWRTVGRLRAFGMGLALGLPTLFLLTTGVLRHFRVLGRHFTPLMVVVLLVLALGAALLWRRGWVGRLLVAGYLALAVCSAAQVRLASRHSKDDYRAASALARLALSNGDRVWWAAAPQGAAYYGLPVGGDPDNEATAYGIFGQRPEVLGDLKPPELIVLSRPDIYDHQGGLAAVMDRDSYQVVTNLPGFKVWNRND